MELPFFGKKKAEESKGRGYVPTDRVRELTGKGFSEIDAIDALRREGFSPDEIDKALTQAVKEGVISDGSRLGAFGTGNQPAQPSQDFDQAYQSFRQQERPMPRFPPRRETSEEDREEEGPMLKLPTIEELRPHKGSVPSMPETSLPDEYYQSYPTEEYVDYAVQESTQDLIEQMNILAIRNRDLENRIKEMNERVSELGKGRANEQQQVLSSVDVLKETVNDVNIRMASLEKAFKETLPALIESVRALTDLVQRLKREA